MDAEGSSCRESRPRHHPATSARGRCHAVGFEEVWDRSCDIVGHTQRNTANTNPWPSSPKLRCVFRAFSGLNLLSSHSRCNEKRGRMSCHSGAASTSSHGSVNGMSKERSHVMSQQPLQSLLYERLILVPKVIPLMFSSVGTDWNRWTQCLRTRECVRHAHIRWVAMSHRSLFLFPQQQR